MTAFPRGRALAPYLVVSVDRWGAPVQAPRSLQHRIAGPGILQKQEVVELIAEGLGLRQAAVLGAGEGRAGWRKNLRPRRRGLLRKNSEHR